MSYCGTPLLLTTLVHFELPCFEMGMKRMFFFVIGTGQDGYTALAVSVVKNIQLDFYASANR